MPTITASSARSGHRHTRDLARLIGTDRKYKRWSAVYTDRRAVVAALLVAAAASLPVFGGRAAIPSGLVSILLVASVWLGGSAIRRHQFRANAAAERADRLHRERDATLDAERTRIARELHDIVTHSVSVMVLQTGAARQIMTKDERRLRALLESVEASGRSALEELRCFLGLLSDQDAAGPRSPQPDVTQIPSLIEQVRRAGLTVELRVEGQASVVPGGASAAAYRIVQEALTNVLKHAGAAPTKVLVRWSDAALELEIVDRGPPPSVVEQHAPIGRGLAGMRDRATMYGGTLEAHPGSDRGYLVRARFPLEPDGP